jgi:hypothetical protein
MATQQLQDEFIAFRNSCMWLRNCYNTFNHLFNSGPETETILRKTAPHFFSDLNSVLQEYFFLQARRITDPAASNSRDNLSLQNINAELKRSGLMTAEISDISTSILNYRSLTSNISNRVVAHADKATALSSGLIGAHADHELELFMQNLQSYTDVVGTVLGIWPLDYRVQAGPGDVQDFIRVLRLISAKSSQTIEAI